MTLPSRIRFSTLAIVGSILASLGSTLTLLDASALGRVAGWEEGVAQVAVLAEPLAALGLLFRRGMGCLPLVAGDL